MCFFDIQKSNAFHTLNYKLVEDESIENGRITPEKALVLLQKGGLNVTKKQAEEILELLTILAKLEVKRYLEK